MINLLKVEWMKVKNYNAFWIFMGLYFVGIIGINYVAWYLNNEILKQPGADMFLSQIYAFPKVWQTVGFMSSWVLYFPGMLIIMLMVNEFNFKTHRQNIIDGWSRKQFIHVKLVVCVIIAAVATLVCFLTALIFGFASGKGFSFSGIENMAYIFLQALAYILFAMFIAIMLRRSGAAMGVYFIYGLVLEGIILGVLQYILRRLSLDDMVGISYALPLQLTDVLLPNPWINKMLYPGAPGVAYLILGTLAYFGIYYFFGVKKFVKDDL